MCWSAYGSVVFFYWIEAARDFSGQSVQFAGALAPAWRDFFSLCNLRVLCFSVVVRNAIESKPQTERTRGLHREHLELSCRCELR